ncbi:hypothetical protein NliqN6_1286 [Naganishia liquefaciens]|uniref:Uncharacterized protein n=1 Tax=Naganishia liquefaciens TaxID=104408 RepID=A0A8H3TQ15_9TREE|nr:hypothetical protein NliqN6_1286 [Naganishia liquefaciens]
MQHTRNTLFARVDALAAQVDRLRARADDLERGLGGEGEEAGVGQGKAVKKEGSGCAEMHGTREERRAARLAGIRVAAGGEEERWRRSRASASGDETLPLLGGFTAQSHGIDATATEEATVRIRMGGARNPFLMASRRAETDPASAPVERPTLAQVIARSNARIHRQIADLEAADTTTTTAAQRTQSRWDRGDGLRRGWVASPEPIGNEVGVEESMTSRGRIVVDRSRAGLVTPPPPPRRGSSVDADAAAAAAAAAAGPERRPQSQVMPVDADEFPTPAEARSGGGSLTSRVHLLAQSSTILESPPVDDASGDDATMAELRLLQNTVTRLNDRLEVARANMAMLAAARSSLREHEQNVERIAAAAADGRFPSSSSSSSSLSRHVEPPMALARRPSFPYPRDARHPHHRARIAGNPPIALVINMDNANSFDVNFDGTIVFRPISSAGRACPDRELIARCLSMLPGGRDGTPSRWMRTTGTAASRPRRAGTSAGYWVRWVAEDDTASAPAPAPASASASATQGLHRRSLDMTRLPRIIAFDFAISPPDDDGWVRADEIEFITPRTRLRATLGPWMHSRVRVEPFENDPPAAAWGTSAHVRQAVHEVGGLAMGHYMRYDFRQRRVRAYPPGERHPSTSAAAATSSTSRAALERVLDGYEVMYPPTETVPATPLGAHIGETDDPENAWLMSYEPAIGQIRASWRAHYRRTRDEDPGAGAAGRVQGDTGSRGGTPRNELWSRDYLDENGVPLPALPVDQAVIQSTIPPPSTSTSRAASSISSTSGRITYV